MSKQDYIKVSDLMEFIEIQKADATRRATLQTEDERYIDAYISIGERSGFGIVENWALEKAKKRMV
jgi:hypothetical protein